MVDFLLRSWDGQEISLGLNRGAWDDPGGVEVVDLRHLWALPGLADCHAHLAADSLGDVRNDGDVESARRRIFAQLQSGVFLVVDKGWRSDFVFTLLSEPPEQRPHLEAAGRIITGTEGYFPGFAYEVTDDELAAQVAASSLEGGWVKLIGDWPQKGRGPVINFSENALADACDVAHAAGLRVAIHAMAPDTPTRAVRAGVDSIEHGLYLTETDLGQLGARGGAWVPTVANTEHVLAGFSPGSTAARVLGEGLENLGRLLPLAAQAGVEVLAGTDLGLPHGAIATEVMRLQARGLSGGDAVAAAGPNAYRYLGLPTLSVGASADLVLFGQDPTREVETISRPLLGLRAGRVVFDRAGVVARTSLA